MKPSNIREFVWKVIDTDISIKKDISRNIINVRALANYIIEKHKLKVSIDSIISAVRRYHSVPEKKANIQDAYSLFKQAKIKTITKMASLSLKKNEDTTKKIAKVLPEVNFEIGEILRVVEASKLFKLIIDQNSFNKMYDIFGKSNIIEYNKTIGMIEMVYPNALQKTPGVFSIISTELGENNISIIDALICSNEHIIIVDEKDLLKSFDILYNICN
jgi:aspartokinase